MVGCTFALRFEQRRNKCAPALLSQTLESGDATIMEFRTGDEAAMGLDQLEETVAEGEAKAVPAAPETKQKQAVSMDRKDGSEGLVVEQAAAEAMAEAIKAAAPETDSKSVHPRRFVIETDSSRDDLLTEFGKDTLTDRYLLPGEG